MEKLMRVIFSWIVASECGRSLDRQGEVPRCALALSDEEGPIEPLLVQHLLRFGARNLPEEPPGGRQTQQELSLHMGL